MSTYKDWKKWGKDNPFYGVISQDKFLGKTLTKESLDEFYRSGEADIDYIFSHLDKIGASQKKFRLAVDYGCGVGRLSLPLTSRAKQVVGYDIAPSMIETAQTVGSGNRNVEFKVIEKDMRNLPEAYDLLNSYIVFQHIPPKNGMAILDQLFKKLERDGFFALQLTFGYDRSLIGKLMLYLRERLPFVRYVANILRGRRYDTPNMRMI